MNVRRDTSETPVEAVPRAVGREREHHAVLARIDRAGHNKPVASVNVRSAFFTAFARNPMRRGAMVN
jgi:hypothetical protein